MRPLVLLGCVLWLVLAGCTGRSLVHGLLDSEGTIYRDAEQEEWGARSTVNVRGFEF